MSAVLRISGARLDVDRLLRSVPANKLQHVWRVGERDRLGRANGTSGATLLLCECEGGQDVVVEALKSLDDVVPRIAPLLAEGAAAEVDFEVYVEATHPASIVLEPASIRALEGHGLRVVVSCYPVDEEME